MIAARYTQRKNGSGFKVSSDVPVPEIGDGDLLVRVLATSICGSDLKIIKHGHRTLRDNQTITLGHEFVGIIDAVGARRKNDWSTGQRVGVAPNIGCGTCAVCARGRVNMCPDFTAFGINRDGSHAEWVQIPEASISQGSVVTLPDHVSSREATLAEPLSCVINGFDTMKISAGDDVLIYGAGPMGLLSVMLAEKQGAARIIVVDRNDDRLVKARSVGASHTLEARHGDVEEAVRNISGAAGVDAILIAAPAPELQQEGLRLLAPLGRLCLFAGLPRGSGDVALDTNAIHYKRLIVTGVTGGSPADYRAALAMIGSGRIDVKTVISDDFQFDQLEAAYEKARSRSSMKIVIEAAH